MMASERRGHNYLAVIVIMLDYYNCIINRDEN